MEDEGCSLQLADDSYTAGSAGYMVEDFDESAPAVFAFDGLVVGMPAQ